MTSNKPQSLATPKLAAYFQDYAAYHRTEGNQITHYFGIPFILISLLGLLAQISFGPHLGRGDLVHLDGGILLVGVGTLWYARVDWKITLPFFLVLLGSYFLGRALPIPLAWTLFVAGWILQGIGHGVFEKKSPAFFKNLTHILIGPLWIFAKAIGYR